MVLGTLQPCWTLILYGNSAFANEHFMIYIQGYACRKFLILIFSRPQESVLWADPSHLELTAFHNHSEQHARCICLVLHLVHFILLDNFVAEIPSFVSSVYPQWVAFFDVFCGFSPSPLFFFFSFTALGCHGDFACNILQLGICSISWQPGCFL